MVENWAEHIAEDLAGVFRGELRTDVLAQAMYSSDASLYHIKPGAIALPKDRDDLLVLVRYAHENKIPLVPRGAGTGVAGESLGAGLVVDFSRHFTNILAVREGTVRVEPGVVHQQLNLALESTGRYFAPDPSNTAVTTIGSVLALDAGGSHATKIGSARDHAQSLEVVLADGQLLEAGVCPVPRMPDDMESLPRDVRLVARTAQLLGENQALIAEKQPRSLIRNRCGYFLRDVVAQDCLNLPRLLVGSEGTLGLFTAATLQTLPLPPARCVVLLFFGSLDAATKAALLLGKSEPSACDLLDRRLVNMAADLDTRFASLVPTGTEAALLVEHVGGTTSAAETMSQAGLLALHELRDPYTVGLATSDPVDVKFLWSFPHRVVPILNGMRGDVRPLPFVEDIAVPPLALNEFLVKAQRVLQQSEVTASLYCHALSGQVHLRPFLPRPTPSDGMRLERLARDLYEVAWSVGGTISGEHGLGLARSGYVRGQYGALYKVFQQVKQIFDPHNLLNPGKVLTDDPWLASRHVRPVAEAAPDLHDLQLRWSPSEFSAAATACHGCGQCKTRENSTRMCPFFRDEPSEEQSPRSKANVLRSYATGQISAADLTTPALRQLASSCFNCKQCQLDCPTGVNIPHLILEARGQYVAANGLSTSEWFLSRPDIWGPWGCWLSGIMNPLLNNGSFRWLLGRFLGVAPARRLPPFSKRALWKVVPQAWLRRPDPASRQPLVVYFVDHFATYHDCVLAIACGRILEHNGYRVHLPAMQTISGMSLISAGDLEGARLIAERNLRALADFARDGVPIVCTEPSAALCLKQEYPLLTDYPDVQTVANQVHEIGEFLMTLHEAGKFSTEFAPLPGKVLYHTPCHLRALGAGMPGSGTLGHASPLLELCKLIPEFEVQAVEKGCSGMAGVFGLEQATFAKSLSIGEALMNEANRPVYNWGLTECSSCKLQMEQSAHIGTFHPLKALAYALGLMPDLRTKLQAVPKALVTT